VEREETADFARLFRAFLEQMQSTAEPGLESLTDRLRDHLGVEPEQVPVVGNSFPPYDLANLHLALTARFTGPGRSLELLGISGAHRSHHTLSEILTMASRHGAFGAGAVDFEHVPISVDDELECVGFGFFLGVDGPDRYAALVRSADPRYGAELLELQVLATSRAAGKALLDDLPELMREHNVFRGKVVSLEGHHEFGPGVGPFRFHRRPDLDRAGIVMQDGVLERIERHVIGVARHRLALREQHQHLRRGMLLYGPPGTGKTHTVRYLMSRLPEFTVVLLAGTSIRYIAEACALARMLQPALVVLEDCDLVAESRDFHHGMGNPLLFQVLNEMDGIADDADVAFLLTTNRADLLEPALAQRPGRVDLAVEIPLPDAVGRRRLLALYGPQLRLDKQELSEVVERTEGTTASFSKELVRRAVLIAAERGSSETTAVDVRAAVDELLSDRDALTRRLLGGRRSEQPDGPAMMPAPPGGDGSSWQLGRGDPGPGLV
jgi:cell division protease FtsH